ncbi:hypothetical protein ALC53_01017 [Atta colombica]|uniref:Uncharacterized protein n=1 Tax=Atta colombica TaxID=520822 RepID=A0A195BX78_9HYME|nr:hypothetical protein ALC53_01017 [Atta colombica]
MRLSQKYLKDLLEGYSGLKDCSRLRFGDDSRERREGNSWRNVSFNQPSDALHTPARLRRRWIARSDGRGGTKPGQGRRISHRAYVCVVEANWSAMNERGRKSKQERERQTGFLRDGETKKEIQLEKRRNEFTRKEDGEYIETEITECREQE